MMIRALMGLVCMAATATTVAGQDEPRLFAGGLAGVSTLSADARSTIMGDAATASLYKPENGLALNLFGGIHLAQFFSLQANYLWNRNELTFVSSVASPSGGGFYEQVRRSSQHVVVADGLVYFRNRRSRIRPYLGTGLAVVRFMATDPERTIELGLDSPDGPIAATKVGLRSHVGIDVSLSRRVWFRYSFSETISGNPISPHLSPAGERGLANFQNLFGLIAVF